MVAKKKTSTAKKRTSTAKGKAAAPLLSPDQLATVLDILAKHYPEPTTALNWSTPLQLLVATILSAQCTDERVNKVTPELFRRFPDAASLAGATQEQLEQLIRSTGFFRSKAKSIKGAAQALCSEHGGEVPASMEQLVALPGVARKTANVVLGTAFGMAEGVVVDTHVKRLAQRLGLTDQTDPNKIERDLMQLVPRQRWIDLAHQLILHGRATCKARRPLCADCPLSHLCPSADVA